MTQGSNQVSQDAAPRSLLYDAFISYSHSHDAKFAPALKAGLVRFAKPLWQIRALRVFLDNTNLSANPALWRSITQALDNSRYFLLVASPEAAASKWVQRELDHWCRTNPPERLLIVLTGGDITWNEKGGFDWDKTTALPDGLRSVFKQEPRWIDAREIHGSKRLNTSNPDFNNLIADLAAPIHGRAKEEMLGEELRQHRRAIRLRNGAVAALAIFFIVASASAYVALKQRDEAALHARIAEEQRDAALRSQSLFLAEKSAEQRRAGDPATGVRLALEALPRDIGAPDRPYVREAEIALGRALWENREEAVMRGHDAALYSLAFSPDGERLVTASKDGTARIWNVTSAREEAVLDAGQGAVLFAHFSPDGGRVLTVTNLGDARLWEAASGQLIAAINNLPQALVRLKPGQAPRRSEPQDYAAIGEEKIVRAAFSPDGDSIAGIRGDGSVCFWDGRDGTPGDCISAQSEESTRSLTNPGSELAFTPDGRNFITTRDDLAVLWDAGERRPLIYLQGHKLIRNLHVSDGGKWLLLLDSAGWGSVWDIEPIKHRADLHGHRSGLISGKISPDGKVIATTSRDRSARLWAGPYFADRSIGNLRATLIGHTAEVYRVAFSADSRLVATASFDGSARVWSADTGELVATLPGHKGAVLDVQFSPINNMLATAGDDATVRIWNFESTTRHRVIDTEGPRVAARMSADGQTILLPLGEKGVQIAQAADSASRVQITGFDDALTDAWLMAGDRRILTLSENGSLQIWNATDGAHVAHLTDLKSSVGQFSVVNDGNAVLAETADRTVTIWSALSGEVIRTLVSDKRLVSARVSPDGRRAATVVTSSEPWEHEDSENEVTIWNLATGEPELRMRDWSHRLDFAPDGGTFYTVANDSFRFWHLDGTPIGAPLIAHAGWNTVGIEVRFSADGSLAATFSRSIEADVRLWQVETGALLATLEDIGTITSEVAFSPDGVWLATAEDDGVVRLWDVKTGLLFREFRGHTDSVHSVGFSPTGEELITSSADGTTRIWDMPPVGQNLIDQARDHVPQPLTAEERARFLLEVKDETHSE